MGILMIIVLMLANIFQVSARSWEVGMRQADVGLEARAAINLLQQDLARAVASSNALQQFTISGSSLSFAMFADEGSTNSAAIERVSYSGSGGLTRTLDGASSVLCEGGDFTFVAIPASAGASGLPGAVEVSLKMTSDKPFASKVRVYAEDHEYDPDNTEWADTHR